MEVDCFALDCIKISDGKNDSITTSIPYEEGRARIEMVTLAGRCVIRMEKEDLRTYCQSILRTLEENENED